MDADRSADWRELYKRALLEPDPRKLPNRIDLAHKAIRSRARQLWYAGSCETREQCQMDAASKLLGMLRMLVKTES